MVEDNLCNLSDVQVYVQTQIPEQWLSESSVLSSSSELLSDFSSFSSVKSSDFSSFPSVESSDSLSFSSEVSFSLFSGVDGLKF